MCVAALHCECPRDHFWSSDKLGRPARSCPGSQAFSLPRPSSRWASIPGKPLLKHHSEPTCLGKVTFPRWESHHLEGCLAHSFAPCGQALYSEGKLSPRHSPTPPPHHKHNSPSAQASFQLPLQAEGRPRHRERRRDRWVSTLPPGRQPMLESAPASCLLAFPSKPSPASPAGPHHSHSSSYSVPGPAPGADGSADRRSAWACGGPRSTDGRHHGPVQGPSSVSRSNTCTGRQ